MTPDRRPAAIERAPLGAPGPAPDLARRPASVVALVLAAVLALCLTAFPTTARAQTATELLLGGGGNLGDSLAEALNRERAKRKLPPLAAEPRLEAAAGRQAEDAADEAAFSTGAVEVAGLVDADGVAAGLERVGYAPRSFATSVIVSDEPEAALAALLAEEGSREQLLSREFADLGVGVAPLAGARLYVLVLAAEEGAAPRIAAGPGGSAGGAGATTAAEPLDLPAARKDLLKQLNKTRKRERRPPVRPSRCLDAVAQQQAERLAERGLAAAQGADAFIRVKAGFCEARQAAENVAQGPATVEQALAEWLAADGPRATLLGRQYTQVGVGVGTDAGSTTTWVVVLSSMEPPLDYE